MSQELPPIVKLAERLLVEIEMTVCKFTRYHKYTTGTELRRRAWVVAETAHLAWRARDNRAPRVQALAEALDGLKLGLQVAHQIRAFASWKKFEEIARLASDLGRQVGGWDKRLKGQNAAASQAPSQRPRILSTGTASIEANP